METLVEIVEAPSAERAYHDLKKHYVNNEMTEEAQAVDFLIKQKFNVNNSNTDKEQRENS